MTILFNWLTFMIDIPSLESWLKTTFADKYIAIRADKGNFGLRFMPGLNKEDVKAAIDQHLASLTSDGEMAKRNKNSRMRGSLSKLPELLTFETAVKNHIASKDLSALTVAEKKMLMGVTLTNDEYDTLTTS